MIKNYNFNISEEEKRQILNLHESRTKRHYLINEQKIPFNDAMELENVKKIQSQLGFTGADLDGKLGPKTLAAITAKLTGATAVGGTPEEKAAAEKAAAEKLASGGGTPEEKAAADKLAADKLASGGTSEEKAAADKLAAEKAAAEKLAAEKLTAEKTAGDDSFLNPGSPD